MENKILLYKDAKINSQVKILTWQEVGSDNRVTNKVVKKTASHFCLFENKYYQVNPYEEIEIIF